nr:Inactive receptor-like protein kinase [Ipomoea batatas]
MKDPRMKPEHGRSRSPGLLRAGTSTIFKSGSYSAPKKSKTLFPPRCSLDSSGSKDESSNKDKASLKFAILLFLVCLGSCFLKFLLPLVKWESLALRKKLRIFTPFGYTRKDVLLIGLGVTVAGYGLKGGLEFFGVDSLQAGNVVQLVLVLGLTVGWISTYVFRVSNKEMTYAQQLRDYESKVMEKRLESLTEAELQALLEQVEEEKQSLAKGDQV